MDHRAVRKVYVRSPNWLGDLVMATPAFARVRSMYMGAEVVLGVKPALVPVLSGSKSFDRWLPVGRVRGPFSLAREAARLRRERFDLAILFTHSLSSALVVRLAGIPERVGHLDGARRFLLTRGLHPRPWRRKGRWGPRREPRPWVEHHFALLDLLGMPRVGPKPILRVDGEEDRRAAAWLEGVGLGGEGRGFLLLGPGASYGPSKLWRSERLAEVADRLAETTGLGAVCIAGPGEEHLAREVAARARTRVRTTTPPLPLDILKAVVRRASLMVTTDAGPRHLAVAFDVPVVVLMGPTHPGFTASNLERTAVVRHDVPCGPCQLKVCPLDHRCMEAITTGEVVEAALRLLSREKERQPG